MQDPTGSTPDCAGQLVPAPATARRAGWGLLLVATVVLFGACLRNIGDTWERGMRGSNAAAYSHVAVFHTVHYGLGVTLGTPAFIAETDGELVRNVNWHHPPGYWLYLALWGWLCGNTPLVLRIAHLSLFLPGLFALFALTRSRCGELTAGIVALLFATCPLVAYYGPMVVQDGVVLSFGLFTLWTFQRHLDAPSRRRWFAVAIAFFVTCSVDFPGFWWGPTMFALALMQPGRWRSVRCVLSLFPVSVLAFATMALHYGLVLGGPLEYLRQLFGTVHLEHGTAAGTVTSDRFSAAMRDLWIAHHNQVLLGLAALGACLVPFANRPSRRLAVLGAAMLVPGLLNYGLMLNHAVDHVFWSMHGFAGLCALAALVPVVGVQLVRAGSRARRVAGAACLLAAAGTAVFGAVQTHDIITRNAVEATNDTPAVIEKALPLLRGCSTTLTSGPAVTQVQFGHTSMFFEIDTAEKLRTVLAFAQASKLRGKVGFVVHPAHRDPALLEVLDSLATRQQLDDVIVYQLKL